MGWAASGAPHLRIGLLDAEPDLGRRIPPGEILEARRRSVVPVLLVPPGSWEPPPPCAGRPCDEPLGFIVLDGLLARDERLAGATATELMGPGDLIQPRPQRGDEELVPRTVAWTAFEHSSLAVLDPPFMAAMAPWPQVLAALLDRSARQAHRLATHQAISQLGRVDERLLLLFWHLAERWGRVVPGGVALALPLRHETLGHLVGAKRSSVTVALGQLAEAGRIDRHADGTLLLLGDPPEERSRAVAPYANGRVRKQPAASPGN